jgi:rSAM/selenodomain-associated transferase 1
MVDVAQADVVAVLTRAPSAGGKSRLFRALGRLPDAALLRALLLDTIDGARAPGSALVVAVAPGDGCGEVAALVPDATVVPQGNGSLGERMRDTMAWIFQGGARRVALIGSDLPEIGGDTIATAFSLLGEDPDALVLGPARDGGYYLIGASRVPPVFDGIEWGSDRVFAQTRDEAARSGLHLRLVEALSDVDTVEDLRRLGRSPRAVRTAAWVSRNLPG